MKVGYARVSTVEQNLARQEVMLQELGVSKLYVDKLSGKDTERPQLQEMLSFIREGDEVIVESFSRLARNTKDLLELTEIITSKGATFVSKKESVDTSTPAGKFMLTVFGAVAQLERENTLLRQAEGIEIAKANGVYKGRARIEIDEVKFLKLYQEMQSGAITKRGMAKKLGMSDKTLQRRIKEYEATM